MSKELEGAKIAILVTDNFEQVELTGPRDALQKAGARTQIISAQAGEVQGASHDEKGDRFAVDLTFDMASPEDYDAVLLPGGVVNADQIRVLPEAQAFVRRIDESGKPVAVICHGSWLLVSAGLAKGRTLTSWPSLQDDIINAGANWVDEEVVVDKNWVSSRKPGDIPAFSRKVIEKLSAKLAA